MKPPEPANPSGEPVPKSRTGYAISEGQLRIDGDRFELDFRAAEAVIIKRAVEWDDQTSKGVVESVDARRDDPVGFHGTTYRGDYAALVDIVDALKRFEKVAGVCDDKLAYDARTALNHARHVVRERLDE